VREGVQGSILLDFDVGTMFPMHFPTCSDNLPIMFPKFPMCSPLEPQFLQLPKFELAAQPVKVGVEERGSQHLFYFYFGGVCNVSNFLLSWANQNGSLQKRQKIEW
jgi:hypothetical protein